MKIAIDSSLGILLRVLELVRFRRINISNRPLRTVLNWPVSVLGMLMQVLEKYEEFQTRDVDVKSSKIRIGSKQKVTRQIFKSLANCSPQFFEENYSAVLDKDVSLKTVLEEGVKPKMFQNTKLLITREAGCDSFESLQKKY